MICTKKDNTDPPLLQYWHSTNIPFEVEQLTATFRDCNPGMRHMLFCDREAEEFIAQHLSDRELAAFRSCAVPAMRADYFRYCAVFALGGIYCDADFRCLGSLMPMLTDGGELFEGANAAGIVTNGFFSFREPEHPLLKLAIEIATNGVETRHCNQVPMVTGPGVFTSLATIWRFGLEEFIEWMTRWGESVRDLEVSSWLRHLESTRKLVGDYGRVADAFSGVRISSYDGVAGLIGGARRPAYKNTRNHYRNWQGSIYREGSLPVTDETIRKIN